MREASFATEIQKQKTNQFVIKSFWITWVLISKNWAHTDNFRTLAELVSECGGKELQTHLLTSPKNASYMSPDCLQKYIKIMDDYLKIPLLAPLKSGHFAFFSDKKQDITSIKQLAIYATFEHEGKIREHFIGIFPLSQMVGTTISAETIMKLLVEYFERIEVSISNSRFSCMDTTNVHSGEKKRLKSSFAARSSSFSVDRMWKS